MNLLQQILFLSCGLIVLIPSNVSAQKQEIQALQAPKGNNLYLVTRGTKSKSGFIADQFNLQDYCTTHVGIGIVENGKFIIYNVSNDTPLGSTALLKDDIQSFISGSDVFYFCIWKFDGNVDVEKLKAILHRYEKAKIAFDFDFNESESENLYCSEFCAKILNSLDQKELNFPLTKKELDNFYSIALKRKTLYYWPVDFFQYCPGFKKIYEVFLPK